MEFYPAIKHLHMTLAMISLLGFLLRGFWMIKESPMLQLKPVKILPHIVDTFLLASAIVLVVITGFYPWVAMWVSVKIILLVAYIIIGTIALKRGKTKTIRVIAFIVSILIFLSIYGIAFHKPML